MKSFFCVLFALILQGHHYRCGNVRRDISSVDPVPIGQSYWCAHNVGCPWLECSLGTELLKISPGELSQERQKQQRWRQQGKERQVGVEEVRPQPGTGTPTFLPSAGLLTRSFQESSHSGAGQLPQEMIQGAQEEGSQEQAEQDEDSSQQVRLTRTSTSGTCWRHAQTQEPCCRQLLVSSPHPLLVSCPRAWSLLPATRREDTT